MPLRASRAVPLNTKHVGRSRSGGAVKNYWLTARKEFFKRVIDKDRLGCKPTSHIFGDSYLSLTYPSIYLPHCPMPSFLQCLVFSTFFSCRSNVFSVETKTALWKLSFSSSAITSLFPSGVDNPFLWDHQA